MALYNLSTCILLMMCCQSDSYLPGNNGSILSINPQSISEIEIREISEVLFQNDINNAGKYISVLLQSKTNSSSSEDLSKEPLLRVQSEVWKIPTVSAIIPLYDNYIQDSRKPEVVTHQEQNEEIEFLDAILVTRVMGHLMDFLNMKGYLQKDSKTQWNFLKTLWFDMYPRSKGKLTSSGFEHVFISEIKKKKISGLHNWIYFYSQEKAQLLNYLGFLKTINLPNNNSVLKLNYIMNDIRKPVSSMFIGTSPELEMALYTLCFIARPNKSCKISLSNKLFNLKVYSIDFEGKKLIGSAYPEI